MDNLFLGQGKVYIALRDVLGKPTGFSFLGDCPSMSVALGKQNLRWATNVSAGGALPSVMEDEGETILTMELSHFSKENLAMALYGDSAVTSVSTQRVDEVVTAKLGMMVPLANIQVLTSVALLLQNSVKTVTYTPGVDYTLSTSLGELTFPAGTSITDGQGLLATYYYGAQQTIAAFTSAQKYVWVRYSGLNTAAANSPVVVDFYKVKLFTESDIPLIGEALSLLHMSGVATYDSLQAGGLGVGNIFRMRQA